MRHNNHSSSARMLVLGGLCAGALAANTASAALPFMEHEERGTVESIDPQANKITVVDAHKGYTKTYSWNQDTKFREHTKTLSKSKVIDAADVKPGEEVKVYYKSKTDPTLAHKVIVTKAAHAAETQPAPAQS